MEITCYRPDVVSRQARFLPAATYNLAVTLRERTASRTLFIPLRNIQYLAIFDAEEMVFIHETRRNLMAFAWRHFRPQARRALDQAVPYEAECYLAEESEAMARLPGELAAALGQLAERRAPQGEGRVLKFEHPSKAG